MPTAGSTPNPVEEAVHQTLSARLFPTGVFETPRAEAAESTPQPPVSTAAIPTAALRPGDGEIIYLAQSGDTLIAVARRFGVSPEEIRLSMPLPAEQMLPPGETLALPDRLRAAGPSGLLLPDSEIVYSPTSAGFDLEGTIRSAGGYLSRYRQEIDHEMLTGAEIIRRISVDTSLNPRLLLALLEYRAGWVYGEPRREEDVVFPIGFKVETSLGLFPEMILTARTLTRGYYGWRSGEITTLTYANGSKQRMAPRLNAGSAALQQLFAALVPPSELESALYGENAFPALYARMFGDPWQTPQANGLFPSGLQPPTLELPFLPGRAWSVTGGPHTSWGIGSPRGAIDFAPTGEVTGCHISPAWITAAGSGLVARSERGVVVLDLDGDGFEGSGWVLLYMHVAGFERAKVGDRLELNDPIGHPSCEGGKATGTHVHIARKYNGEWLPVDGAFPLAFSGWQVTAGEKPFEGTLVRGGEVVTARTDGSSLSLIKR